VLTEKEKDYAADWFRDFMVKYGPCDVHTRSGNESFYMYAIGREGWREVWVACGFSKRELELERERGGGVPTLLQIKAPDIVKAMGDTKFDAPQVAPQPAV
jgi:hypothetical protein